MCPGPLRLLQPPKLRANPQHSLGAHWSGVEFISGLSLRECPPGLQSIPLCPRLGLHCPELSRNAGISAFLCTHALLQILLALFYLGTRPRPNPVPGIFSLPGILSFTLGALLFLVLIILVTQRHRWRTKCRGGLQGILGHMESVCRQKMGPGMTRGKLVSVSVLSPFICKIHLLHINLSGLNIQNPVRIGM